MGICDPYSKKDCKGLTSIPPQSVSCMLFPLVFCLAKKAKNVHIECKNGVQANTGGFSGSLLSANIKNIKQYKV